MNIIYGQNEVVHDFVASIIPDCASGFGECSTLGICDDTTLIAGMVYHNWHPEHGVIEISGAATSPRWLARPVLHEIFAYPFEQLGVQLVVMRVSEHDKRLKRILTSIGFDQYRIPRLRGRDRAEIIYTLADDVWRRNKFEERQVYYRETQGSEPSKSAQGS